MRREIAARTPSVGMLAGKKVADLAAAVVIAAGVAEAGDPGAGATADPEWAEIAALPVIDFVAAPFASFAAVAAQHAA
jgi:hypothetical protein